MSARCKSCLRSTEAERRRRNKEALRVKSRIYYEQVKNNPEFREKRANYKRKPEVMARANEMQRKRRENPDRKARDATYKKTEKYKLQQSAYYQKNADKIAAYSRARFQRIKKDPHHLKKVRAYATRMKRDNPAFNLRVRMSARMLHHCKTFMRTGKNGRAWQDLVGYSTAELCAQLERKFSHGMTWHNRHKWHIDHIVPVSWWDIDTPEHPDFKKCWGLSNLQPLWRHENLKKVAYRAIINGVAYTKEEWLSSGRPLPS